MSLHSHECNSDQRLCGCKMQQWSCSVASKLSISCVVVSVGADSPFKFDYNPQFFLVSLSLPVDAHEILKQFLIIKDCCPSEWCEIFHFPQL